MPGPVLQTDAFVLARRPPAESFQTLTVFCPTHGTLIVLQRVPKKPSPGRLVLDLFDEASFTLETPRAGGPWFVREARLLARPADIGRDYDALRRASALATLIARNPAPAESRAQVGALLREALAAFASSAPPALVYFKSLWRFARDEGHPVREQWLPSLSATQRAEAARLLRTPLAGLSGDKGAVANAADLATRLEAYLRGHTELLLD
jgi:hypothetical protein